jgi:hypothetical protein
VSAEAERVAECPEPALPIRYHGESKAGPSELAQNGLGVRKRSKVLGAENPPELHTMDVGERRVSLDVQPTEECAGDATGEYAQVAGTQRGRELVTVRSEQVVEG